MRRVGLEVFAVEPTALQLTWPHLAPGHYVVRADGQGATRTVTVEGGGPRAVTLTGLEPASIYDVFVDGPQRRADAKGAAPDFDDGQLAESSFVTEATVPAPAGPILARVATISDLHLGEPAWGYLPRLRDTDPDQPPPPVRCLAGALAEITAWRPDLLVVKGDITAECRRGELEEAGRLLADRPFPVLVLPGNHDGGNHRGADPVAVLAGFDVAVVTAVTAVDLPGLRVVAVPTVRPGRGTAAGLDRTHLARLSEVLHGAPGGALVCLHHHPRRRRLLTHWPPGIGYRTSVRLLDTVAAAHPATLVTAGHTHRHRRWHRGRIVVTETGSVKDYPGTWTAYEAYADGIVQSVRRVEAIGAIEWTERGKAMLLGAWGRYAPGRRSDRCFTHRWPSPAAARR